MDCHFSAERLARLAEIEEWHFWFVGRRKLIERFLNSPHDPPQLVLDLGCGTGFTLQRLAALGYLPMGVDLRREGLERVRSIAPGLPLVQANVDRIPLKANSIDGIVLLDVLEHVDDQALLAQAQRILKPGAWLVFSVPAMPWLWSYRDQAAGHLRRYTRAQLVQVLTDANFRIEEMRYYQCLLMPLVILMRWFGRAGPSLRDREDRPRPIVNSMLTKINLLENKLGDVVSLPFGTSLIGICRKV